MNLYKGFTHDLTVGLRDAYFHGLAIACPTAENTLGWALEG